MEGLCSFCGKPVTPSNWQAIRQVIFESAEILPEQMGQPYRDPPPQVVHRRPGSQYILFHALCAAPPDLEEWFKPLCGIREVTQPRHVHYVDIGDLLPEEALQYLQKVRQVLLEKSANPDELFLQAVRTSR